jgi:hypothetical protein
LPPRAGVALPFAAIIFPAGLPFAELPIFVTFHVRD